MPIYILAPTVGGALAGAFTALNMKVNN